MADPGVETLTGGLRVGALVTPDRFGPWSVTGIAGRGGMGVVYRARHRDSGATVAVKTVSTLREEQLAGIRAEIHALMQVRHPGVVRVLDSGVEEGRPWYAMELLEGRTLLDVLRSLWKDDATPREDDDTPTASLGPRTATAVRPGPARRVAGGGDLAAVLSLVERLCEPLAEIHAHGIVHRDLKPSNVFLRDDGHPVLVDFGLAARFEGAVGRERAEVSGVRMGTGWYMAPEQAEGQLVDARADLYALGVILYELVTGRRPFDGRSASEVIAQHRTTPPRPPSELVDGVRGPLEQLILRLLAKRRRDRLGHAEDVATALAEMRGATASDAPRAPRAAYLYRPDLEGRAEPMAQLGALLEALRRGTGGCVFVGGESGVGKTALVTAAGVQARLDGLAVVTGECRARAGGDGGEGNTALHAFVPFLEAVADHCLAHGAEVTRHVLGPRGRMLERYVPALATLPGQEAWPAPVEVSAEAARARLLDDLAGVLVAYAEEQPLLLVLDDLQWADELTLLFLSSRPEGWFERARLLVVGTWRSDELPAPLQALLERPGATTIRLGRLDDGAVRSMVSDMLALPQPDEALVEVLARHSEGIPFYVAEYLRAAVSLELLYRRGGRWHVARGAGRDALALPRSLRELVGQRLDGLDADAAALAEAAAVLGREFDGPVAAAAAGLDDARMVAALSTLVSRVVVEPAPQGALRFVHDKLREVAYERLDASRARALHERAARALEEKLAGSPTLALRYGELAHHWEAAGDLARARDYAAKAGEQSVRAGASREAGETLARALAFDDALAASGSGWPPDARAQALRLRGEAFYGVGRFEEARSEVTRALQRVGQGRPESDLALAGGLLREVLRQSIHRLRGIDPLAGGGAPAEPPEPVRAWYTLVHVFFHTSELPRYVHATLALLNRAERAGPSAQLAEAYALTALIAGSLPLHGVAQRYWQRALDVADRLQSPSADASVRMITSIYGTGAAQWDRVLEATRHAARVAAEIGDHRRFEESTALRALAEYHSGTAHAAREAWALLLARVRLPQPRVWALCGLAEVAFRQGRAAELPAALHHLQAAADTLDAERLADSDAIRIRGGLAAARWAAGEVEPALREAEVARRLVKGHEKTTAFWTIEGAFGAADTLLRWLETAPFVDARRDALLEAARDVCRGLTGYARVYPVGEPRARLCEGRLARLRGQRAVAEKGLRAAVAAADRLAMPWDAALARRALAGALPPGAEAARLQSEADAREKTYLEGAPG